MLSHVKVTNTKNNMPEFRLLKKAFTGKTENAVFKVALSVLMFTSRYILIV